MLVGLHVEDCILHRVWECVRVRVCVCASGVHEFPSHQRDDVRQLCRCHCTHAGARAKLRMCVHMDPCMYLCAREPTDGQARQARQERRTMICPSGRHELSIFISSPILIPSPPPIDWGPDAVAADGCSKFCTGINKRLYIIYISLYLSMQCRHLCMYACMHAYMHACMYECMCVRAFAFAQRAIVSIRFATATARMQVRARSCACVHMDVCMYVCRHACVRVCLYVRTCKYVLKQRHCVPLETSSELQRP